MSGTASSVRADDVLPLPLERWKTEISLQLDAAQAELEIQDQIAASIEKRYRHGDVSLAELHSALECQRQAMGWTELLEAEVTALEMLPAVDMEAPSSENITHLRVPGLPLLFASDSFAWIEVSPSPRSLGIVEEIQYLDQKLHDISLSDVQSEELRRQMNRLHAVQPSTPEILAETELVALHLRAAGFNPNRLSEILHCSTIQSRFPSADRNTASFQVPSAELMSVTKRWATMTRQLLLAQTDQVTEHLRQRLSLIELSALDNSTGENSPSIVQQQIESQEALADSLRRDLRFLRDRGASQSQAVSTHLHARAGYLMRILKRQWEQVKDDVHTFSSTTSLPIGTMPKGTSICRLLKREQRIAEAQLKYAMELYRLESGRSDDPSVLLESRTQLFVLAADLRVEKADLDAQLKAAQQQAADQQNRLGDEFASLHFADSAHGLLRVLESQRQRLLLEERRAELCLKLVRMAENRQAVAQHES